MDSKPTNTRNFSAFTITSVKDKIISSWLVRGGKFGLKETIYILACIIHPYTCPHKNYLPGGLERICQEVLIFDAFFESPDEGRIVMEQLKGVILRKGQWVYVTSKKQDQISVEGRFFYSVVIC